MSGRVIFPHAVLGMLSASILLVGSLTAAAQPAGAAIATTLRTRLAFSQPVATLDPSEQAAFARGHAIFVQPWLIAPSASQPDFDGLGPLYNRLSCAGCHLHNGRGEMPDGPDQALHSAMVRLSVQSARGIGPDPVYGSQLQTEGIIGVPAEGRAGVRWHTFNETLADGSTVSMRSPQLLLDQLAYGPLAKGVMTSLRMAPALIGEGLLQAVPVAEILALAKAQHASHGPVQGQPNWVWDLRGRRFALGRFGYKANQPSVRQQTEMALSHDMGITSAALPQANCTAVEKACLAAPNGGTPEITSQQLDALVAYQQGLAVPRPSHAGTAQVRKGGELFRDIGCASCHQPTLHTGSVAPLPVLAHQVIHPYTDLLLHDMGPGLADGRPDGLANGRQWRTAPLWGLGLAGVVGNRALYLHDGRARSLTEAILWHGGEARASRQRFRQLDAADRAAVLTFLNSL